MRVLGLMSGTSLDGIDAAIIDTDGEAISGFGSATLLPFTAEQRRVLDQATQQAVLRDRDGAARIPDALAEQVVLSAHIDAVDRMLSLPDAGAIDLIGFHGQTILHRPARAVSVQLGDPAALAHATGIDVIAGMRRSDLFAGGQGAPIVPIYHAALARHIEAPLPIAFLNLGGVANLTWVGPDGRIIAFDTGPANGMIDLMVQARGLGRFDTDGQLALNGTVDQRAIEQLMGHEFISRKGPKALDRHDIPLTSVDHLSAEDAAATLTAFTALSVEIGAKFLPEPPTRWIVCGGGGHNPAMMAALRDRLGRCDTADDIGFRGDFIEAEAMAFLAARAVRGLPITYPETTGVSVPMTGGFRYRGNGKQAA